MTSESDPGGLRVRLRQKRPVALDAAFECGAGELLALVGPSGSGKTTVLRCIAGLASPPDGEVTCNGEIWLNARGGVVTSPQRRRVGLVFQHYALFPHLDALANVACAMTHRPRGERGARARALLARVNMEGLEARRPAELSGGQRQRVALARGPSPAIPGSCSSTSPSPPWISSRGGGSGWSSRSFAARSASRWCWSRMTSTRPNSSATA